MFDVGAPVADRPRLAPLAPSSCSSSALVVQVTRGRVCRRCTESRQGVDQGIRSQAGTWTYPRYHLGAGNRAERRADPRTWHRSDPRTERRRHEAGERGQPAWHRDRRRDHARCWRRDHSRRRRRNRARQRARRRDRRRARPRRRLRDDARQRRRFDARLRDRDGPAARPRCDDGSRHAAGDTDCTRATTRPTRCSDTWPSSAAAAATRHRHRRRHGRHPWRTPGAVPRLDAELGSAAGFTRPEQRTGPPGPRESAEHSRDRTDDARREPIGNRHTWPTRHARRRRRARRTRHRHERRRARERNAAERAALRHRLRRDRAFDRLFDQPVRTATSRQEAAERSQPSDRFDCGADRYGVSHGLIGVSRAIGCFSVGAFGAAPPSGAWPPLIPSPGVKNGDDAAKPAPQPAPIDGAGAAQLHALRPFFLRGAVAASCGRLCGPSLSRTTAESRRSAARSQRSHQAGQSKSLLTPHAARVCRRRAQRGGAARPCHLRNG